MIKRLFKTRPITAAIDFSNGWIKIAQAETRSGQITLLDVAAVQFPVYSSEKETGAQNISVKRGILQPAFTISGQVISRKEFSRLVWYMLKNKPQNIMSCIPRQSVMIRFMKLPTVNEVEIDSMLEFQATKQLPFSKEDIMTGYKIQEIDREGYSKVLFTIVQENILNNYLNLLKSTGLSPATICLSSEAIINSFLNSNLLNRVPDSGIYVLIDVDYLYTELLICEGKNVLFSRAVGLGANSLYKSDKDTEISAWVKALIDNIRNSLIAFKKEKSVEDDAIKNIFITGGIFRFFKNIQHDLQAEFSADVEYWSVLDNVSSKKDSQVLDSYKDMPISLSSVIGMALNEHNLKIDLLPRELKTKRFYRQKQEEFFRFYILFSSIFICLFLLLGVKFYYKISQLKSLDRQLNQIRPYVKKAELVSEKLNVAENQANISSSPLEVLKEIYSIMPQDMNLYGFSVRENNLVLLRGTTGTMARVFEVVSMLENSKHFKNVKVSFANKRRIENQEVVDFQINCLLK